MSKVGAGHIFAEVRTRGGRRAAIPREQRAGWLYIHLYFEFHPFFFGVTALMFASQQGHVEVVRLLLAHPDVEVNKGPADGATALIVASQRGHVEVVRLLLARQDVEVTRRDDLAIGRHLCGRVEAAHGEETQTNVVLQRPYRLVVAAQQERCCVA
jgi:hypothetical protein